MMEPNEIRAELMLHNIKVIDLAKKCGVKHPNISGVIAGKRQTPYIRAAIAEAIGKTVSEIWPDPFKEQNNAR